MFTWLTIGMLFALTACTTPSPAAPTTPAGTPTSLDGTAWNVTAINGSAPVAGARQPSMSFTKDTTSGTTGCNYFSAGYTLNGSALTFTPGPLTAMACSDDVMKQEAAFISALTKVARLAGDDSAMQLQDAAGQTLFTLAKAVAASAKPLEGTTWQLETIRTDDTAASVVAGSSVTMQINDGKLSGKACNNFNATVTIDGESITVGPVASTRMACLSDDLTKQEHTFLGLLGKTTGFTVLGDQLELSAENGSLFFRAQ
jgi:heat shock protein HslJ